MIATRYLYAITDMPGTREYEAESVDQALAIAAYDRSTGRATPLRIALPDGTVLLDYSALDRILDPIWMQVREEATRVAQADA